MKKLDLDQPPKVICSHCSNTESLEVYVFNHILNSLKEEGIISIPEIEQNVNHAITEGQLEMMFFMLEEKKLVTKTTISGVPHYSYNPSSVR